MIWRKIITQEKEGRMKSSAKRQIFHNDIGNIMYYCTINSDPIGIEFRASVPVTQCEDFIVNIHVHLALLGT